MATFEAAHDAIRTRFGTEVEDALSISVQYDNAPYEHPEDAQWIRFAIQDGQSFQREFGGGKGFENPGIAFAQIFTPIELGDESALQTADTIVAAFRAQTVGGITYRTPSVNVVGREGESKWWQVNVTIPYLHRDQV